MLLFRLVCNWLLVKLSRCGARGKCPVSRMKVARQIYCFKGGRNGRRISRNEGGKAEMKTKD